MVSNKDYYREWYAKNKERRNAMRRDRYKSDPVYAELCRKRSKAFRDRANGEKPEVDDSILDELGSYYVYIDDKPVPANTVADMAEMLGRSTATVYKWIWSGLLPETPFQGPRLYTDKMVSAVKKAVDKRPRVSSKDEMFTVEITEAWQDLFDY